MTTWTEVTQASTSFDSSLSDLANGYVFVDYVIDDYILGSDLWAVVSPASTVWT